MQTKTDHELRTIAAELIRDMNKVTGTTTAEQARMLGLHKANVAACVNQGRVENLGKESIKRLLRTYGFEISENEVRVRQSETCPVFFPRPFSDEIKDGLRNVVNRLRSIGMTCAFYRFWIDADVPGKFDGGGILFAYDRERKWACIALSNDGYNYLAPVFEELGCLPKAHTLFMKPELYEDWVDSPPHRSEVMSFFENNQPF